MENIELNVDPTENGKHLDKKTTEFQQEIKREPYLVKYKSFFRQIILGILLTIGYHMASFPIASTSLLPLMLQSYSPNDTFQNQTLHLLQSLPVLAGIPGNYLAFYATNFVAPLFIYKCCLAIAFITYLPMAFAPSKHVLIICRVILFSLTGVNGVIVTPLMFDLVEPQMRGLVGNFIILTAGIGFLLVFLVFSFLEVKIAVLICSAPLFIGIIGSFFIPESPYWLMQMDRQKEAEKCIRKAIGPNREEIVDELLLEKRNRLKSNENITPFKQIFLLKKTKNWKSLLVVVTSFFLREFSGCSSIIYLSLSIMQSSNICFINEFYSMIILSLTGVLSFIVGSFFFDKFGRRKMLITAYIIASISMFIIGIIEVFELKVNQYISLTCLLVFITSTGLGISCVSFLLLGEIIQTEVKYLCTAITMTSLYIFQSLAVLISSLLNDNVGVGFVFLLYCVTAFTGILYSIFFVPESKSLTLEKSEQLYK